MKKKEIVGAVILGILFVVFAGLAGRSDVEAREYITGIQATR